MKIMQEFREFATRGNVLDLAIGLIIGTAFNKIVSSFVNDIIMPPIGLLLGRVNFSDLYLNLSGIEYDSLEKAKEAGAATINYGIFINHVIDFLIIAATIFLIVRWANRFRRKETPPPTTKECPFCFSKINVNATRCPECTSTLENAPGVPST